jgi:phosphate transport system substrate-binding protein
MRRISLPAVLIAIGMVAACGKSGGTSGTIASATPTAGSQGPCSQISTPSFASSGITKLAGAATKLSGAGATFPAPLYSLWASKYKTDSGTEVAYQSIGSGGGVQQIIAQTVDFGASDAPMKDDELTKAKGGAILHVPTVFGAVVATYNLQGVSRPLQFDGETLGKIFAGKITTWNDPALAALNPGVGLPKSEIVVVHRSDGSGTTNIFTTYLSQASATWVSTLGGGDRAKGKEVAWPTGVGGKGNEGVSGAVRQTPGAIGYVELTYALAQGLPVGLVKNSSGAFIEPCIATVSAAAVGFTFPPDLRFSLTNAPGKDAYPISGATWLLVYENQKDAAKGKALVNFLAWIMDHGEQLATQLHYAPLSDELRTKAIGQIKKIKVNGQPLAG